MKKINLRDLTFLLLGISSTSSCLAIVAGGRVLSVYTICLIFAFGLLLTDNKFKCTNYDSKLYNYYGVWTLTSVLSSIFGALFFMGEEIWMDASLEFLPKIILYFIFLVLFVRSIHSCDYAKSLLHGLLLGVIINAAWATVDSIIYYSMGFSITNELFRSYIVATGTRYDMLSLIIGGVIRSGGLNGDPANIGMFAPILASYALYSRKVWLYILAILSIFSSVSIVGLASTIIISFFYFLSNKKGIVFGLAIIVMLLIGGSYVAFSDDGVTGQMLSAVSDRLEEKTETDSSDKDNVRAMYWLKFIPAAIKTPTAFIIGTGYGTASYAYINGGYVNRSTPYDPEQTYCSTYFDVGLWGFIVFVSLHLLILKRAYKKREDTNCLILFAGIEGILISFMGYHYTIYSVSMLFLIAGIVLLSLKTDKKVV